MWTQHNNLVHHVGKDTGIFFLVRWWFILKSVRLCWERKGLTVVYSDSIPERAKMWIFIFCLLTILLFLERWKEFKAVVRKVVLLWMITWLSYHLTHWHFLSSSEQLSGWRLWYVLVKRLERCPVWMRDYSWCRWTGTCTCQSPWTDRWPHWLPMATT